MVLSESSNIALSFVLGLSGAVLMPSAENSKWSITENWQKKETRYEARLESRRIPDHCVKNPEHFLVFPRVVHGAHKILLNGALIRQFGDPNFQWVRSFYGKPVLSCSEIQRTGKLEWQIFSYSKFFSRISKLPEIHTEYPPDNFMLETIFVISAGALLVLAVFGSAVFMGKVSLALWLSLMASQFFFAMHFSGSILSFFGLSYPMILIHKIADVGLWLGSAAFFYCLLLEGFIGKKSFSVFLLAVSVAIVFIVIGVDGDSIQFGTTIPFLPSGFLLLHASKTVVDNFRKNNIERRLVLKLLSLSMLILFTVNDILVINGFMDFYMLLPIGIVFGFLFFALSVNENIVEAYDERDHLRENLEAEVERKTSELESTMKELKEAQGELVNSAKLASLGTLSAGIAHEINNSLNYVNGSLTPLERILKKEPDFEGSKSQKLITMMREGLSLTFDIIKSLRNFTGLNQAKINEVALFEISNNVLTILKSKIPDNVSIDVDIDEEAKVFGSIVGLNQIVMNLVVNAMDALPKGGQIAIVGKLDESGVVNLFVRDNGMGMAPEVQERIFDPFFTTKDVGKGTGLGLHLVKKEVDKHKAILSIQSEPDKGTEFKISFPKKDMKLEDFAA